MAEEQFACPQFACQNSSLPFLLPTIKKNVTTKHEGTKIIAAGICSSSCLCAFVVDTFRRTAMAESLKNTVSC